MQLEKTEKLMRQLTDGLAIQLENISTIFPAGWQTVKEADAGREAPRCNRVRHGTTGALRAQVFAEGQSTDTEKDDGRERIDLGFTRRLRGSFAVFFGVS